MSSPGSTENALRRADEAATGWSVVVAVCVVLLAACGGSGGLSDGEADAPTGLPTSDSSVPTSDSSEPTPDSSEPTPDSSIPASQDEVDAASAERPAISDEDADRVDALVSTFGEEAGFVALVNALGRGYDVDVVMAAVDAGTLQADGLIVEDGSAGEPTRPTSALLVLDDDVSDAAEPQGLVKGFATPLAGLDSDVDGLDGRGLFTVLRDARANDPSASDVDSGVQVTRLIVSLARSGYSMDQIIQALVFDENIWRVDDGCTALAEGLDLVSPVYPDAGGCAEKVAAKAQEQADDLAELDSAAEPEGSDSSSSAPAGTPITFTAELSGEALSFDDRISAAGNRNGGYESAAYEASVDGDQVELFITYQYYVDLRGSREDPGPSGDQFCGATFARVVLGSGPAGSPTSFELEVLAHTVGEYFGALCQDGDGDLIFGAEEGDRGGRFSGQFNALGIDGEFDAGLAGGKLPIKSETADS